MSRPASGGPPTARRRRVPRAIQVAALLSLAGVLLGCGASNSTPADDGAPSGPPSIEASAPPTADVGGEDVARAHALIDVADPNASSSVGELQGVRFTNAGTAAARQALEEGTTGDGLWAATWIYASNGTDPAPLLPLLDNDDSSIRLMAAAALVSLGRAEGFDVLVRLIESEDSLRGSEPPTTVSRFALHTLARYTGVDLAPGPTASPEEVRATAGRWEAWLAENRDQLTFDADNGTWATR